MNFSSKNRDFPYLCKRLPEAIPDDPMIPLGFWTPSGALEEYMNVDNREYVFRVLNDVTKLPFLAEAAWDSMDVEDDS